MATIVRRAEGLLDAEGAVQALNRGCELTAICGIRLLTGRGTTSADALGLRSRYHN